MYYVLLAVSIALEIVATTLLKKSDGFTRLIPSVCSVAVYLVCFFTFSKVLTKINLGIAYATWCAAGIVATSIIAAVLFGQKLSGVGVAAVVLIIAGCILLNLFGVKK